MKGKFLIFVSGYCAALIATAAFLPGAAALFTVLSFLTPCKVYGEGKYALFLGLELALLTWVISAIFCTRFTDARYAIPSSYGELRQRLALLKSQLSVLCPGNTCHIDPCKEMACRQANEQLENVKEEFHQRGLSWVLARGYINAWNRLHRAEEAMIEVAPKETVIAGALNDVLRLQGSKIDHDDDLIARVRQAINVIDPSAGKFLQGPAATPLPLVITTASPLEDGYENSPYSQKFVAGGGSPPIQWSTSQGSTPPAGLQLNPDGDLSGTPTAANVTSNFSVRATDSANVTATKAFTLTIKPGAAPVPPVVVSAANVGTGASGANVHQEVLARAVLRDVRCAINEFRDGRWNGLIVARNRLLATMMFTGITAYMLLVIAIITGAHPRAITAASAFYLVGATIGLLNQLRSASQNDSAVEDYGLSTARLITMPLFCGLAAIGGVVLMAMPQMAGSYSAKTTQLTITTPSKLPKGVADQAYHKRLDATGGTPPYTWNTGKESPQLPKGMDLSTSGDLIARQPEKTESKKPITFTAQVEDRTESRVEKTFFLNITSLEKGAAGRQPSTKESAVPATTLVQPLEDIFDLQKNLFGLLLAAVFGLTPGLLFDKLQQQSEKYKADLKGSEVTQTKPQPPK